MAKAATKPPKATPPAAPRKSGPPTPIKRLKDLLLLVAPEMRKNLPKYLTVERMMKIALMAAAKNPKLYECTDTSIQQAMMNASAVGLEPGGPLQYAALVPYKDECQFQIMYRGLIELATRDGRVKAIEAEVVYENDFFVYEKGLHPVLRHIPFELRRDPHKPEAADAGDVLCAYAIAWLPTGQAQVEITLRRDLEKIENLSKAKRDDSPWKTWREQMRRKTSVKRLCKFLPSSDRLALAIDLDNRREGVIEAQYTVSDGPVATLEAGRHSMKKQPATEQDKPEEPKALEQREPGDEEPDIVTDPNTGERFNKKTGEYLFD